MFICNIVLNDRRVDKYTRGRYNVTQFNPASKTRFEEVSAEMYKQSLILSLVLSILVVLISCGSPPGAPVFV